MLGDEQPDSFPTDTIGLVPSLAGDDEDDRQFGDRLPGLHSVQEQRRHALNAF